MKSSEKKRWVPSAEQAIWIDVLHSIHILKEIGEVDHSTEEQNDFPACIGCGYCCMKVMCWIGLMEYGFNNRCPALTWSNTAQRYYCKLALEDSQIAKKLHVGSGCTSDLNTWRRNVRERRSINDNDG